MRGRLHKGRRSRGYTLMETLLALLIMAVLTLCVSIGTSAAGRVYRSSLFASESDLTAATLDLALSDVLRYAYAVQCEEGSDAVLSLSNENYSMQNGRIVLQEGYLYLDTADAAAAAAQRLKPLVSGNIYTVSMLTDFQLRYRDGVFSGSYTLASRFDAEQSKVFVFRFATV